MQIQKICTRYFSNNLVPLPEREESTIPEREFKKYSGAILIRIAPVIQQVVRFFVAYAGAPANPSRPSPRRIASKRLPPR